MKSASNPLPIAIVGGGFSGTLAAIHLAKRLPDTSILLFEEAAEAGPGLAYGTGSSNHLLNVRAGAMSAFAERPDHFREFASQALDRPVDAAEFLPRAIYGGYLRSLLKQALERHPKLEVRHTSVIDLVADARDPQQASLVLKDGTSLEVSRVVLATGNRGSAFRTSLWSVHTRAARDADAYDGLHPDAPVVIIGTALSMIDAVNELERRGHRGPIHVTSRHGLLPHAYAPPSSVPVPELDHLPDSNLRKSVRLFRKAVKAHEAAGGNWRDLFAAIRPYTPGLWQELSPRDRQRFLRFISPFWEIHRHQCAPETRGLVDRLITSGRLTIHRGALVSVERKGDHYALEFASRTSRLPNRTLEAARILDATGPARDIHTLRHPLICNLLRRGFLTSDVHRLGVETLPDYRAVQRNGRPAPWLHVVGPMLRARYFEATAVPELRLHAAALAARIAGELQQVEAPALAEVA
ncbi:FAD/NAD(P)-binding protein [Luteolibacter ambystomatis]|uniref:FAD/NAD(P)-binding protein n=1 Tax=Luteolibacter ambystomatis TaxID=2824561 RepID=A0A975PGR8_9BACT|nr:FAD/NAD(P)-binding protein [Luteolibacter ambystomatis]QUE52855.1 FAD/NAD(P)-binding protein [Luteolibacter ambystomatis]